MTLRNRCVVLCLAVAIVFVTGPCASGESVYRKPPQEVLDVLHAPLPPSAAISPTHDWMILVSPVRYPPIADLAQPMLRLGGVRVVARNHGIHGERYGNAFVMTKVADGSQLPVALPPGAKVTFPVWSADGKRFAFENITSDAIELWVGEAGSATVRRVEGVALNPVLEDELQWMPDQRTLLVKTVPKGVGAPPPEPLAPKGPAVQEASGEKGGSSTYEVRDVLKNGHDEELFDYYGTAQLAFVDADGVTISPFGSLRCTRVSPPRPTGNTSWSRRCTARTRT